MTEARASVSSPEGVLGRAAVLVARMSSGTHAPRPGPHSVTTRVSGLAQDLSTFAIGRVRTAWAAADRLRTVSVVTALCVLLIAVIGAVVSIGSPQPTPRAAAALARGGAATGNALLVQAQAAAYHDPQTPVDLPAATTTPAPAPPSLAGAAPLRSHEVFGFAPYWTLPDGAGFDVKGISTLAYFSIGVNGDGSLQESGAGWNGYQSQDLANLITRAHAAGDRVVLTVNCFDQAALDQLTSSPTAAGTLSTALLGAIAAKNLDGVNLDFEGQGSADQSGLTRLVTEVSSAMHGANPHYQVTMDTYASSAGDPNGFYDIPALTPAVDAFFVMAYQLNLAASPSATSPLTSSMFSDQTTINQYAAAVPPSKVILGMPYFGIDWPTTDGTLTAQATGASSPLSYGQVMAAHHPIYWDTTTDTAWTSYQVGNQWHETFFENPTSLFEATQMATAKALGGVGIWALGMDGNDPSMLAALLGFAPATKAGPAGPPTPTTTSVPAAPIPSSTSPTTTTTAPRAPTSTTTSPSTTTTIAAPSGSTTSTSTSTSTTTSTTVSPYDYSGTYQGVSVTLTPVSGSAIPKAVTTGQPTQLTKFVTNDTTRSCLADDPPLKVWPVQGSTTEYLVVAQEPGNCANADFIFTTSS